MAVLKHTQGLLNSRLQRGVNESETYNREICPLRCGHTSVPYITHIIPSPEWSTPYSLYHLPRAECSCRHLYKSGLLSSLSPQLLSYFSLPALICQVPYCLPTLTNIHPTLSPQHFTSTISSTSTSPFPTLPITPYSCTTINPSTFSSHCLALIPHQLGIGITAWVATIPSKHFKVPPASLALDIPYHTSWLRFVMSILNIAAGRLERCRSMYWMLPPVAWVEVSMGLGGRVTGGEHCQTHSPTPTISYSWMGLNVRCLSTMGSDNWDKQTRLSLAFRCSYDQLSLRTYSLGSQIHTLGATMYTWSPNTPATQVQHFPLVNSLHPTHIVLEWVIRFLLPTLQHLWP